MRWWKMKAGGPGRTVGVQLDVAFGFFLGVKWGLLSAHSSQGSRTSKGHGLLRAYPGSDALPREAQILILILKGV